MEQDISSEAYFRTGRHGIPRVFVYPKFTVLISQSPLLVYTLSYINIYDMT